MPKTQKKFLEGDLEGARNHKNILCIFEQLTHFKINIHKSEINCFGAAIGEHD
jgi:hypothetical protein